MVIKDSIILEGIKKLKAIYQKPISKEEAEEMVKVWQRNTKDWTEGEFVKVVAYIQDNTNEFERFPKPFDMRRAYFLMGYEKVEELYSKGCKNCYKGMRRYLVAVPSYNFDEKKIMTSMMSCVAACDHCEAGKQFYDKEGDVPYYSEAIAREDTTPMKYDINPMKEIVESMQTKEIDELPF